MHHEQYYLITIISWWIFLQAAALCRLSMWSSLPSRVTFQYCERLFFSILYPTGKLDDSLGNFRARLRVNSSEFHELDPLIAYDIWLAYENKDIQLVCDNIKFHSSAYISSNLHLNGSESQTQHMHTSLDVDELASRLSHWPPSDCQIIFHFSSCQSEMLLVS